MTFSERIQQAHESGKLKGNPSHYNAIVEKIGAAHDESGLFDSEARLDAKDMIFVHDLVDAGLLYCDKRHDDTGLCIAYGLHFQKYLRVDESFDLNAQTEELESLRERVQHLEAMLESKVRLAS